MQTPLVVSFSGGRTSGLMLRMILDHFGGKLPDGCEVVFCNTGKEHGYTLDFCEEVSQRWGVRIRWVEWTPAELPRDRWREVDHKTASRNGEPFAALIAHKSYLPSPVMRFCSIEMKILTTHRFLRGIGWEDGYTKAVGLRYDEPGRVARGRGRDTLSEGWALAYPLYDARVTAADVAKFWKQQPFDLMLPVLGNSPAMGNCDLCFLKGIGTVASIIAVEPQRAIWWAEQEEATGRTFSKDRPSYAAMMAQRQLLPDQEGTIDCACTD